MSPYFQKNLLSRSLLLRPCQSFILLLAFLMNIMGPLPGFAQEQVIDPVPHMSAPGEMVRLSPEFTPAYLKGIVIHPENALRFDFIVNKGDAALTDEQKKKEYTRLTKYFLASVAIPDDDQWVNLSPYEKDRIIRDDFGKTEMGRDLLAQDYMLKQITASLIDPHESLGKKFWEKVYAQARVKFGTSNIPVNTFNKVWIVPDDALIYEKGNAAYVIRNHLRVMLEEDYLSLQKHTGIQSAPVDNKEHSMASKIVKEIILPALECEVNRGKNFAALRQVYSGMLLAAWYKRALKESLLSKIYANKAKVIGVDQDPRTNEMIYQQYLKAYKKGVFNFIKNDMDRSTNEMIPRKNFSGGLRGFDSAIYDQSVRTVEALDATQNAAMSSQIGNEDDLVEVDAQEDQGKNEAAQMGNLVNRAMAVDRNYLFKYFREAQNPQGRAYKDIMTSMINDQLVHQYVPVDVFENVRLIQNYYRHEFLADFWSVVGMYDEIKKKERLTDTRQPDLFHPATERTNLAHGYELYYQTQEAQLLSPELKRAFLEFVFALLEMKDDHYANLNAEAKRDLVRRIEAEKKLAIDDLKKLIKTANDWLYNRHRDLLSPTVIAIISKERNQAMAAAVDKASIAAYGGIDLNAAHLNLQIKRDGHGVPLPISQQDVENIHIDGLIPVILQIKPALETSVLSELQGNSNQTQMTR